MANNNNAPLRGGGLSLYANLLDPTPNSSATISRAPVAFQPSENSNNASEPASQKPQINAAALRFQPTKRPQLASQKGKPKHAFPRALPPSNAVAEAGAAAAQQRPPAKSSYADWAAGDDDDVNGFYAGGGPKPQRGGKRRKKNKKEYVVPQSWDDYYDPTRPTNYEEYRHSDERTAEIREWKDRLYAHRQKNRLTSDVSSDADERPSMGNQFAPPAFNAFAPQPSIAPPASFAPPPPPADLPQTAEEAFARRLALSQGIAPGTSTNPSTNPSSPAYSPPPPPPKAPCDISRAPVRYAMPEAPAEIPSTEGELAQALADEDAAPEAEDDRRTNRPGQKGFAERLMNKYGWSKGSGLGADGSGIVNPLHVQVQKRKKKPDSEGGGFAMPATGKIVGGRRNVSAGEEVGKFGAMSEVIRLKGMVGEEDTEDEGGLIQEIGEECAEKYGRVERVFIWRQVGQKATVFVKFTSQLSALRAVNALEGRIFDGNSISAMFYDTEEFEAGIYE